MHSTKPTNEEIRIGRLEKRIRKLTEQRDHYKTEYLKLREFLDMFPYYERRARQLFEERDERKRVKEIETRCKEQAELIKKLLA